jgi:hypothetical protein
VKALYEANADTNAFTDGLKSKLEGIPANVGAIDDVTASGTTVYSSSKTQALHNAQQTDIGLLTQSILTLSSTSAQGEFGINGLTLDIGTTEQVLPFNVITQSTNTDVFEITNGTGIVKEAGTYSFISTVEIEDVGADGDVATLTFNLRDTTTNDVYYTQSATVEISGFDRDAIPFNSLMVIPDTLTLPVEVDINVVCSQSGYRVVGFKSVISASVANASITREHNTLVGRSESEAHPASAVTVTPQGNLSSVNVQLALEELQSSIDVLNSTIEW